MLEHVTVTRYVTPLREVTGLVPPGWFGDRGADAYAEYLLARAPVVPEVIRR